jgi:hypothetical protein
LLAVLTAGNPRSAGCSLTKNLANGETRTQCVCGLQKVLTASKQPFRDLYPFAAG